MTNQAKLLAPTAHSNHSRTFLIEAWQKTFHCPVPLGCHTSFLMKAIAWHQQAQKHQGLTAAERRKLLSDYSPGIEALNTGSHLIRVWQGETHQVTVLDTDYLYAGKPWKSLSSIAKAITGTPWSGPVFFGVKK